MNPQPSAPAAGSSDPFEEWLGDVSTAVARRRSQRSGLRWWLTRPLRAPRVIRRRVRQDGFLPTMELLAGEVLRVLRGVVGRLRRSIQ